MALSRLRRRRRRRRIAAGGTAGTGAAGGTAGTGAGGPGCARRRRPALPSPAGNLLQKSHTHAAFMQLQRNAAKLIMKIGPLPDALEPGFHCVRTPLGWIRGFMAFQLALCMVTMLAALAALCSGPSPDSAACSSSAGGQASG